MSDKDPQVLACGLLSGYVLTLVPNDDGSCAVESFLFGSEDAETAEIIRFPGEPGWTKTKESCVSGMVFETVELSLDGRTVRLEENISSGWLVVSDEHPSTELPVAA